jgi:small subunit ribosomal protein S3
MEVKASAKYMRISPRKIHKVLGAVKGKPVETALNTLKFMPQKAAGILEKVIRSAVANADQNPDIDIDLLVVRNVVADQGPTADFETHQPHYCHFGRGIFCLAFNKGGKSLGQKVNPIGLRLGIVKTWESRWFGGKNYAEYILEDHKLRKYIKDKLYHAGVSRIEIERSSKRVRLRIYTSRPGIVIGKKGAEISQLKKEIEKMTDREVLIDIQEVRKPEIDAQLVAENVALQIIRRVAFRRAMKRGVSSAMRFGALGVKISCSGRLGGAEMARTEWYREGRVPLHTLRADIDYGFIDARTTYGVIGVKVFIFKGEILKKDEVEMGS